MPAKAKAKAKLPKDFFDPGSILLSYQHKLADDDSRFKFALQSRQTGKDFASGYEGVRDIFSAESKGQTRDWLIAAPSERQSLESLGKWKLWTEAFKTHFPVLKTM